MRRTHFILIAAVCLVLGVGSAAAAILSNGINTQRPAVLPTGPGSALCSVLWFAPVAGPDDPSRLAALGLLITTTSDPADLNPANLAGYDVLVVAYTGPGILGAQQAAIQAYVTSGHGLLIHQPDVSGSIDYAPAAFGVNMTDTWWCGIQGGGGNFEAKIVNGVHPITAGLTDADLSGDFDEAGPIGPGYTVLAVNAVCGTTALAAGTTLNGRVVFETGNATSVSFDPGSNLYWAQLFNWLCTPTATPTLRSTWGNVKIRYR